MSFTDMARRVRYDYLLICLLTRYTFFYNKFLNFYILDFRVWGAPINAIGRLCAHLKGDLARQINKLFVDSGTVFFVLVERHSKNMS